jgi:hypothetical protein
MLQQSLGLIRHIAIQGLTREIGIATTQRIGWTESVDEFEPVG